MTDQAGRVRRTSSYDLELDDGHRNSGNTRERQIKEVRGQYVVGDRIADPMPAACIFPLIRRKNTEASHGTNKLGASPSARFVDSCCQMRTVGLKTPQLRMTAIQYVAN